MFLNNYQYPEKREAFKIFLLFLVSIFIRIPVVLLFGDINLENEWMVLHDNITKHGTLALKNLCAATGDSEARFALA